MVPDICRLDMRVAGRPALRLFLARKSRNTPAESPLAHIIRLWTATVVSIIGMVTAWRSDITVRQWTLFAIAASILGIWLGESGLERAVLVAFAAQVLLVELLNTAIEAAIDRIGPELHPLSKAAKDIGSMAVFLSFIICIVVWMLVLMS